MENRDKFAIDLLVNENIDDINKDFYGRYTFPWSPSYFKSFPDNNLITMLNHDLGYFDQARIGTKPKIWVAGCGTNQAIETALRYPSAEVIGTDVSTKSLEVCGNYALQLGIKNLTLEERSLNSIDYKDEFDYIICTGVIHHNADPEYTLKQIANALKPNGIMELMVYNYYHRILSTAIQKAIRSLSKSPLNFELQREMIGKLIKKFPFPGLMSDLLSGFENLTDAELADTLLQPVEYSYTIETLGTLLNNSGMEFMHYCLNEFDVSQHNSSWDIDFKDELIQANYESLSDHERWQIANLLKLDESPRLWFYVQRKDAEFLRKTEKQICEEFLNTKFKKGATYAQYHYRDEKGNYTTNYTSSPFPTPSEPNNPLAKAVFEVVQLGLIMKDIFTLLHIEPSLNNVNLVRNQLCTVSLPYIIVDK